MNKIKLNKYFSLNEFQCPCCHRVMLHEKLLDLLYKVRLSVKKPVVITSGFRCDKYNKKIGGDPGSYHLIGMAADITVPGMNIRDLWDIVNLLGFTGIGYYEQRKFCHVDVRPGERKLWYG